MHVIPTDKPSMERNIYKIGKELFITNDEEIKKGDWQLSNDKHITIRTNSFHESDKKIILTTDQDLIKDGVQAIDNAFLEWLVKNPSCEEVEVTTYGDYLSLHYSDSFHNVYKIIIPKQSTKDRILSETPKLVKEKVRETANDLVGNSKQDWFCPKCNSYVSAESVTFEENHQICNTGVIVKEEPKQETLEEAANEYENSFKEADGTESVDFIEGAKWQQERSYSEEDMIQFAQIYLSKRNDNPRMSNKDIFNLWFEQSKKK
jgi:hypothetical protein